MNLISLHRGLRALLVVSSLACLQTDVLAVETDPATPTVKADQLISSPDAPNSIASNTERDQTLFQHDDLVDRVQEKMVKIFGAVSPRPRKLPKRFLDR